MGIYKFIAVVIALAMILMPLAVLKTDYVEDEKNSMADSDLSEKSDGDNLQAVKVFMSQDDLVLTVTREEYLIGVLAAEMPPTYHEQALKAQAVAAYTYLLRKISEQESKPDASLKGAYLTNDSSAHQGYLTEEERKEKWGDKAESYEKKLQKAVSEISGKVITYDGEPIIAAFHANNCGVTHSAKTVWGNDVPYLQSVTSTGDKLSPDCIKTVAITPQQFSSDVSSLDGCELSGEAKNWVGKIKTDSHGYVESVEVGGGTYTGMALRDAVGLRSAVFTYEFKDGNLHFTTEGYGHGVGMSQYGADYMARQGSTWEEIIKHYYKGVEITGEFEN